MPFFPNDTNPLAQIVELKSVVKQNGEDATTFDLQVELGIFQDEVTVDRASIAISLKQASLSMDLQGLEVVERSKYGIDHTPSKVSMKATSESTVQTSVEKTRAFEAIVSGELGLLAQGVKGSGNRSGKQVEAAMATLKENRETQVDFYPVKAVGNGTWRVTDVAGANLDQTFLNYDTLCGLRMKSPKPNHVATGLSVHAPQKHITAEIVSDGRAVLSRVGANKQKVIGILVAKGLHEATSKVEYNGLVTFSVSTTEYEG
ncbi:hypothetical protein [Rhizobium ruizarguesonis]|uniref:hypothetical protein n=1 Tax=Rhizobium ruizarguesonis TaxID=2081791 RepID=UPI001031A67D|nr:hypothetical protein [Rhizobium ruizarguesonis]TAW02082.1 hypothetical protein ELI25_37610 [Rhizobium ruizarguesonis]TAZ47019.1 hypothetical protein ELH76_32470 [Rhizobium ruizarguesonis]